MKSLRAFWHWVDNERPETIESKQLVKLSLDADHALDAACRLVAHRVGSNDGGVSRLRAHWPAIRDLSLAICEALGRVELIVPAQPKTQQQIAAMNTDGLKPLRMVKSNHYEVDDIKPWTVAQQLANMPANTVLGRQVSAEAPTVKGQIRSNYDPQTHRLTIYTTVSVAELDQFRGLAPSVVVVRGEPRDYAPLVLKYLPHVIGPMLHTNASETGVQLHTPQSYRQAFGL